MCLLTAGIAGVLCTLAAAPANAGGAASGRFETSNWKVPIVDAYAFHDKANLGEGNAILVAISNSPIGKDYLDGCWDRRYIIDNFLADEETRVVYLEFRLDGSYSGYSYYFGSGDGCGFCGGGNVKSTVKLKDGRLTGTVATKGENVSFDLKINVALAPDDRGKDQGPGGGAVGKAYLAYHAALVAGDVKALKGLVSAGQLAKWQKAEKDGRGDAFVSFLRENRPDTVSVRQGFARGDHGLVLLTGSSATAGAMHGESQLILEGSGWKVDDETVQAGPE